MEPIELRSLQLQHLRWSLRHAYENVPHYRRLARVGIKLGLWLSASAGDDLSHWRSAMDQDAGVSWNAWAVSPAVQVHCWSCVPLAVERFVTSRHSVPLLRAVKV
jgi:hypothetical protein